MSVIKIRWTVDELENVLSQFDTQKVYRSTTTAQGPWTEITGVGTRVDLVAGETAYFYDDVNGDPNYFYAIAYFNTTTTEEGSQSDPIRGDYSGVQYLTIQNLYDLIGRQRVDDLFDESLDGDINDEASAVYQVLASAESEAASYLLNNWGIDGITELAGADRGFKSHVAWVALEFASQRRPGFTGPDGGGAFKVSYDRAIAYFKQLSRSRRRSKGESAAGVGANTGGALQPRRTARRRFIFAPDKDSPNGRGGF